MGFRVRVGFTTSGRPHYFEPTLRSWAEAIRRADFQVQASFRVEPVDPDRDIELIREHLSGLADISWHVNDSVLCSPENPRRVLAEAFTEGHGFVVLAEDDTAVSPDILGYFDWCDRQFRDRPEVQVVLANQLQFVTAQPSEANKVMSDWKLFRPSVWATWRDRWDDWIGPGWANLDPRGWDWGIAQTIQKSEQMVAAAPIWSRSRHIGLEGRHVRHAHLDNYIKSQPAVFLTEFSGPPFEEIQVPRNPLGTGTLRHPVWDRQQERGWAGEWDRWFPMVPPPQEEG